MGKVFAYDTWSFYFVIGKLFLSCSHDIYPRQQIIYFTKRVDNLILYPFQPKCRAFKNLLQESLLRIDLVELSNEKIYILADI